MSADDAEGKMARAFLLFVEGAAESARSGGDPNMIAQLAAAFASQCAPQIEKGKRIRKRVAALMPTDAELAPFLNARCFVRPKETSDAWTRRDKVAN